MGESWKLIEGEEGKDFILAQAAHKNFPASANTETYTTLNMVKDTDKKEPLKLLRKWYTRLPNQFQVCLGFLWFVCEMQMVNYDFPAFRIP